MGGLVLAQDQASSRHFGMPGSAIAFDEIVDRVLALARIGPALDELLSA
jgi:chemotaxis response regulator CheB